MKRTQKDFWISLAVGLLPVLAVWYFNASSGRSLAHLLCDCFFVAGVLVAGSGGLLFVRNQGMFDLMSFGVMMVLHIHWPWTAPRTAEQGKETFAAYRERKREERRSPAGVLWAGAVYLALSVLMLVLSRLG